MEPRDPNPFDCRLELLHWHGEHVAGCVMARDRIVERLMLDLVQQISRRYSRSEVDPAMIWDAVSAALLEYCAKPAAYDPQHGVPLGTYLQRRAEWSILMALRAAKRRQEREMAVAATQEVIIEHHSLVEAGSEAQERLDRARQTLDAPVERAVFELWARGERRTEAFAELLGIAHCPVPEQRRAVKRAKDRIRKRLRKELRKEERRAV